MAGGGHEEKKERDFVTGWTISISFFFSYSLSVYYYSYLLHVSRAWRGSFVC